ncbi:MAG: CcoQ/FixQ family Cbb3-type cytochrome c oxidase assembly chaperone [Bacteroidota bacterium]
MLKFVKHHMESIFGIEIYPVISLSIFFVFFVLVSIYVMRMPKSEINTMGNLPLEDGDTSEEAYLK